MQLNTLHMVHEFLERHVRPGAFCIDATAGKGRDAALLCRLAGPSGRVLAFDIQEEAVRQTRALLAVEGLAAQVILDSHAHMEQYAEPETVDCVVFNLGRLPGGDPRIFTQADSSVAAIRAGLRLLRPGGVMAIALYYGKGNGYSEKNAVSAYLETLDDRMFSVLRCDWANRRGDPPMPIFIWKER
ncbi:class I SAM-dependent methyltransferase [uncultured Dysosmobacter sp.]|uniref:tRNA (mnm(5)s(2)U34)-methyltransferase n=1 Tax=uncultured Dysosmobacter sp. TaxID=2591384 RepID=UPI0026129DE7|nr:class I SAM-dependent methyltransferase [uncultured Dysosmobacter sp.]